MAPTEPRHKARGQDASLVGAAAEALADRDQVSDAHALLRRRLVESRRVA